MSLPTFENRRPDKKPNSKKREYAAFFKTLVWKKQSQRVLHRDRYICQLRLDECCTGRATQAHHITYERFGGDERDDDLKATCRNCNLLERERRITRRVLGG